MPNSTLSKDTKITVGLLLAVAAILLGILGVSIPGVFMIYDMRNKITVLNQDHYGKTAASEDALREAMANPGHKVPDPRRPGEYHLVRHNNP